MFTGSRFNRTNGFETILFGMFLVGIVMITIIAVVRFGHVDLIDSIKRLFETMQSTEPPSS